MIKIFVSQLFIIFLILVNNSIASNQNIFEDAKIYFEKKDYNQSKFLFQKFLVFNPKDYLSWYKEAPQKLQSETAWRYWLAKSYQSLKQMDKAKRYSSYK